MDSIVLFSDDEDLAERILTYFPEKVLQKSTFHKLGSTTGLLDFLKYEIPDLVLLQVKKDTSFVSFFQSVEEDPWLESIGFVLLVDQINEDLFDRYRGFNIAYFLEIRDLNRTLNRVMGILTRHRDLLNHAGLLQKLTVLSGELVLETDLFLINYYASLFANFLYREVYVDRDKRFAVQMVLSELLTNAMEHGNAGITFEEKTRWQESGKPIHQLVEERLSVKPWKGRTVSLAYQISPKESSFTIQDMGAGFKPKVFLEKLQNQELAHGRGIFLSRQNAESLEYNASGTAVTVKFLHETMAEKNLPQGFFNSRLLSCQEGQTIFTENATSDSLYYIVSGEYTVYIQGKRITSLSPQDIFLGEMSFLMGNRRSATVICSRPGKLSEISRQLFTETVKKHPEYGIFLSKLLARRLREANLRFVGTAEYPMYEA